jgi:hypothetical protein
MNEPKLKVVEADPFDLSAIRLSQNFVSTAGVKKQLTTIPVRKPNSQDFFRVHPAPEYRLDASLIVLKDDRESYLVPGNMQAALEKETTPVTLFTGVTRQNVVFLWPVRLPLQDDKSNDWWISARSAAETAITAWTRLQANMSLGAYEIMTSERIVAEPEWPELSFQELLRIAFRDRLVTSMEHPAVQRLQGLV